MSLPKHDRTESVKNMKHGCWSAKRHLSNHCSAHCIGEVAWATGGSGRTDNLC